MTEFGVTPEFIASLYEAALDPEGLKPVAALVGSLLGVDNVGIWLNEDGRITDLALAADFAESAKPCPDYYHRLDLWQSVELLKLDRVVLGSETISGQDLMKTEFYSDPARNYGISNPMGAAVRLDAGMIAIFGVEQPDTRLRFTEEDKRPLQAALPHLKRALQLRLRNRQPLVPRSQAFALNALAFGAVICNQQGSVVYANPAADNLVRQGAGVVFRCNDKSIGAIVAAQSQKLSQLVNSAALGRGGGSILLTDHSGTPSLLVLVTPLPNDAAFDYGRGHALVAMRRIGAAPAFDQPRLIELFGLSPAQAALAMGLYEGKSFEEIALERSVKVTTLRTHFAEVLARTRSKNLRDLVRVLGTIPQLM